MALFGRLFFFTEPPLILPSPRETIVLCLSVQAKSKSTCSKIFSKETSFFTTLPPRFLNEVNIESASAGNNWT